MSNRIENGNKKRIALDIFIIIVIAASLVGIILRCVLYSVDDENGQGKAEYCLVVTVENEYETVSASLKPGDKVFLASSGEMIGAIMADLDTEEEQTSADTQPKVPAIIPSATVKITLTEGRTVEGSYLVGNREYLTPGDTVELYTAGTVFTAHIEQISKLSDSSQ